MQNKLKLHPIDMTPEIMAKLEDRCLIYRLCPESEVLKAARNETAFRSVYESDDKSGGHKLITITTNTEDFSNFGSHRENEEFLFIGAPNKKPIYLLISYLSHEALAQKLEKGDLNEDDFILLKVKHNDPGTSFFTMLKGVPHGECSARGESTPSSFYVTECKYQRTDLIDLKNFIEILE